VWYVEKVGLRSLDTVEPAYQYIGCKRKAIPRTWGGTQYS
jgi:hypothetical protein